MSGCQGVTVHGEPCASLNVTDGWCPVHRPGGEAFARDAGRRGGLAMAAKQASEPFTVAELPRITTLEDAKLALDQLRMAVMMRRLTHSEGTAASKCIDSWVRAESAAVSVRLVNELKTELDGKTKEIDQLRKQLAVGARSGRGSA